ncbi:MAG: ethylbenzene dehydrogenase-related protein, partial [bacterium]
FMRSIKIPYSYPVRIAHALAILSFFGLIITGLRLAWLKEDQYSEEVFELVGALTPTGNIYQLHILSGILLIAAAVFYLIYIFMTRESRRLFDLFSFHQYSSIKKIIYLLSFFVSLVSIFTGVTIYSGLYTGSEGYLFNSLLHHWCFRLLSIFIILHIIETLVSRKTAIGEIFFQKLDENFLNKKVLIVSALIPLVVVIAAIQFFNASEILYCEKQNRVVIVDGRENDIEWYGIDSIQVRTFGGANFQSSVAEATIKTFHNKQNIYFLIKWADPTRSFNRQLIKTDSGWVREVSQYKNIYGENIYSEDKLGLYFGREDNCASICHIGSGHKLGLHYTDNDTADIWQWMAVSTNPADEADDRWWGGYDNDIYGGQHFENKASGGYKSNLNDDWHQPYFLPINIISRNWIWYGSNSYGFYKEENDTFPIGYRVPAVLVAPTLGDRGDVTASGKWRNGYWTVELSRKISTGSDYDTPFRGELYLGIALFDNADIKHTYHLKPIKLVIK